VTAGPFLDIDGAAELLVSSRRVLHQLASERRIPHRRLPGQRKLVFVRAELESFVIDPTLELEVVELERNGRIVRPKAAP